MKTLKQLVRNIIDPDRDLGHVDRDHQGKKTGLISGGNLSMSTGQAPAEKPKVKTGAAWEEDGKYGEGKERKAGEGEPCGDCKQGIVSKGSHYNV